MFLFYVIALPMIVFILEYMDILPFPKLFFNLQFCVHLFLFLFRSPYPLFPSISLPTISLTFYIIIFSLFIVLLLSVSVSCY
jgi:hypothetical protein